MFEIYSKSKMKTLEWGQWGRSGILIVNTEQILPIDLDYAS